MPRSVIASAWHPRIAALPGKNRQEGRERDDLGDGALEQADHEAGGEGGQQVHLQPGDAAS